jgi:PilZ domain
MIERRKTARTRVAYGGVIAFNEHQSTMNCVIRNFSNDGAEVKFDHAALLPKEIDLLIARKKRAFSAKIIWRQANKAGLAFRSIEQDTPISLDWARRVRVCESEQRELQNRIAQLMSVH